MSATRAEQGKIACFVPGKPEPQGSTKAFNVPSRFSRFGVRAVVTHDNSRLMPWRALAVETLNRAAADLQRPVWPREGVRLSVTFVFSRLTAHPKNPAKRTPDMTTRPDLDKLLRAVGDALTTAGIVGDDDQIMQVWCDKRYAKVGEQTGTHIAVERANEAQRDVRSGALESVQEALF